MRPELVPAPSMQHLPFSAQPPPSYVLRASARVTLSEREGVPPNPLELQPLLDNAEWHFRAGAVLNHLRHKVWSTAERVFLASTIVLTIAVVRFAGVWRYQKWVGGCS